MSVKIRLKRIGMKRAPHYRIVVSDARSPRDGRFIEELGIYNPKDTPIKLKIDLERAEEWIANGAQPTDTVRRLMKRFSEMSDEEREASSGLSKPASSKPVTLESKKNAKPVKIKEATTKEESKVTPEVEVTEEAVEDVVAEPEVEAEAPSAEEAPAEEVTADTTEKETEEPA